MGGDAGPALGRRIEGWSRAPLTSRVPAIALVALVGIVLIPLAIHAAADIPIYYYWACRVG